MTDESTRRTARQLLAPQNLTGSFTGPTLVVPLLTQTRVIIHEGTLSSGTWTPTLEHSNDGLVWDVVLDDDYTYGVGPQVLAGDGYQELVYNGARRMIRLAITNSGGGDVDVGAWADQRTDLVGRFDLAELGQLDPKSPIGQYEAMVLKHMAPLGGSFFSVADGVASPLTDFGPNGVTDLASAAPATVVDGPWPGTKALTNSGDWTEYTSANIDYAMGASEEGTWELWFKPSANLDYTLIETDASPRIEILHNNLPEEMQPLLLADPLADPGAWVTVTAYVAGDRVRPIADDGTLMECEVGGTSDVGEPTWPAAGATVVDGTVTWRNVGLRAQFNDIVATAAVNGTLSGFAGPVLDTWNHMVLVKDSQGYKFYMNGILDAQVDIPAADTTPGSFGTPVPLQYDVIDLGGGSIFFGAQNGGSNPLNGDATFLAFYKGALTAEQIAAHYAKGVELGLGS